MPDVVVRGGTVVDASGRRRADVAITDGVVSDIGEGLDVEHGTKVLDAGGCLVSPGLVDLHAHLRQPGREESETVETAARSAALGGYTAIVAMPNTEPAVDSAAMVHEVLAIGRDAMVDVAVAGAITVGRAGERLAPMAEMAEAGARIFTDDGTGVQDGGLMRRALDYAGGLRARGLRVVLAQHCEDVLLAAGGVMNEGEWSSRLGLPGIPSAAEEAMVARDIALVRQTGVPVHFLHLSTAGSVELVRRAKGEGLAVTAEVAPHHLVLTDQAVSGYDPLFKVNPPLRTDSDVLAVRDGVADGTIDAVATDHAPHAPEDKDVPFDTAPPGMIGLETALAVALTALAQPGRSGSGGPRGWVSGGTEPLLTPDAVLALVTGRPALVAGLEGCHGGPVRVGAVANICVVDPTATWTVDPERLASRSRNTPFAGWTLTGRVRHTVLRGEPVVIDAEAQR
ncbi:MAG: dihydroorotase [Acidimicrobiales bacterium]